MEVKNIWQKCPVCGGMKEINAVPNYPIYGQIPCPVCKGTGILNQLDGKPPKTNDLVDWLNGYGLTKLNK